MRGCTHHRRDRGSCRAVAVILVAALAATRPVHGGIVGQWDFANGWNSTTGEIPGVSSLPGLSLVYLPKTYLYGLPAAQSGTNPPPLQFATTGSFRIGNLGATGDSVVMRVPDMRGYGLVTGLMAQFPKLVNGVGSPTKLNQYSIVMDVYVPGSTDAQQPPHYLTLLQTRLGLDGAWFIDKRYDSTGVASGYGGTVPPAAWRRLAIVMNLSTSGSTSQYQVYVDGALAASIVPDTVPMTSERNYQTINWSTATPSAVHRCPRTCSRTGCSRSGRSPIPSPA